MPDGEKTEDLGNGVFVYTAPAFRFGQDALLLAAFSQPRPGERCCDLGTGCGVIPLYWRSRTNSFTVDAVEIEETAAALAARSAKDSGCEGDVRVLCADYLHCAALAAGIYDRVVCNPPYFRAGCGKESPDAFRRAARSEERTSLAAIAERAAGLLKNGGRFSLCIRPERLAECLALLREKRIEPKRLRLVQQRAEKAPWLALVEGRRNAREGLSVEPVLLLHDHSGGI